MIYSKWRFKISRIMVLSSVAVIVFLLSAASVMAQRAYVSDSCEITFRRGAGNEFKVLRMLKSGDALNIEENLDGGWSRVTLEDGESGYVISRFITTEEPLSRQAVALKEENSKLKEKMSSIQGENDRLTKENGELQQNLSQVTTEAGTVRSELEQLRTDTQDVVKLRTELETLKKEHQDLKERYREAKVSQEEGMERYTWLAVGAGILVIGMIAGALSRRSAPSGWGRGKLS